MKYLLLLALICESNYIMAQKGHESSNAPTVEEMEKEVLVDSERDCNYVAESNEKGKKPLYRCETVPSQDEVKDKIVANQDERMINCIGSLATHRGDLGVKPLGGKKFEVEMSNPLGDDSEKKHMVVDAENNTVEVCKFKGDQKICKEANNTLSDEEGSLKDVIKENIAMASTKPFNKLEEKYSKDELKLMDQYKELKRKKHFMESCEDIRECIVSDIKNSDKYESQTEQKLWALVINRALPVVKTDDMQKPEFKAWEEVINADFSMPTHAQIMTALENMMAGKQKVITHLPQMKKHSKAILKRKMASIDEASSNSGSKLCGQVGLANFVQSAKSQSNENQNSDERIANTSRGASSN